MCDTKYFAAALDELHPHHQPSTVGNMTISMLSILLRRAQELKDADAAARNEEHDGRSDEERGTSDKRDVQSPSVGRGRVSGEGDQQ